MPTTLAEAGRARPALAPHGDAATVPALCGTVAVPLTALATPDQITICSLYQWLHAFHAQLVLLHADPAAVQRMVVATVAQDHWAGLFQAVQHLGAERPAPPLEAVLHVLRGSFAALAAALELRVAEVEVGDNGGELVRLVQDQLHTLRRLIPDLAAPAP